MEEHKQYNLEPKQEQNPIQNAGIIDSPNVYRLDKTLNIKDFYSLNDQEFRNSKGQKFNRTPFAVTSINAVYSVAVQDYLIGVTSLVFAPSIGLPKPSLVGTGKTYIIKDEVGEAGTTTITVRSANEELIDGASTSTITTNYASKGYYSNGANWFTYQT